MAEAPNSDEGATNTGCHECGATNFPGADTCRSFGWPLSNESSQNHGESNIRNWYRSQAEQLEPIHLDLMDSEEFESICRILLERIGYTISSRTLVDLDESIEFIAASPSGLTAIECRHNPRSPIGKSVIQKFHSSMASSGLNIGMVITTGEFTKSASDYVERLAQAGVSIKLIGKALLTDMATRAGIEFISRGHRMSIHTYGVLTQEQLTKAFGQFYDNYFESHPIKPSRMVRIGSRKMQLLPAYMVQYYVDAAFKTSNRFLHHESYNGTIFLSGLDGKPLSDSISKFFSPLSLIKYTATDFAHWQPKTDAFQMNVQRTRAIAENEIIHSHTREISYIGDNGHIYRKSCEPKKKDVQVIGIQQVYIPLSEIEISIGKKSFDIPFVDHASRQLTILNNLPFRCDVCGDPVKGDKPYICNRCGACCHPMTNSHGDGFKCKSCGTTLCRACTVFRRKYIIFKKPLCKECDDKMTELKQKGKRHAQESPATRKRTLSTKMKPDDRIDES